jgi:hypothetical protein
MRIILKNGLERENIRSENVMVRDYNSRAPLQNIQSSVFLCRQFIYIYRSICKIVPNSQSEVQWIKFCPGSKILPAFQLFVNIQFINIIKILQPLALRCEPKGARGPRDCSTHSRHQHQTEVTYRLCISTILPTRNEVP